MRTIEDASLVDLTEDWSNVRSPDRARRRRRYGYRQNIKIVSAPKKEAFSIDGGRTVIMHPSMADELRKMVPVGSADLPTFRL